MRTTCFLTIEPLHDSDGNVIEAQVTKVTQRYPRTHGVVMRVNVEIPNQLLEAIPVEIEIPEKAIDDYIAESNIDLEVPDGD